MRKALHRPADGKRFGARASCRTVGAQMARKRPRFYDEALRHDALTPFAGELPQLRYRVDVNPGSLDKSQIKSFEKLLASVQNALGGKSLTQQFKLFQTSSWRLVPESDSWATINAKWLRSMPHDINKGLVRHRSRSDMKFPVWLSPFVREEPMSRNAGEFDFGLDDGQQAQC